MLTFSFSFKSDKEYEIINLSSCESGRLLVPDESMGFWVAITKKGSGNLWVSPSIETLFSSMASKKALCDFGLPLFNSSAKTIFVKMGPFWKISFSSFKILYPKISLGNKSDVNWILLKFKPKFNVIVFASVVLPDPGLSSINMLPSEIIAANVNFILSTLPTTVFDILVIRVSNIIYNIKNFNLSSKSKNIKFAAMI